VRDLARGGGALDVEFSALDDLQRYVDSMPNAAINGARIALNDVVSGEGLTTYRKAVEREVDFPSGYLRGDDRLGIGERATNGNLAISVIGRFRPTSLARFVTKRNAPGEYGVSVRVKRGAPDSRFERGFLLRLKNQNLGLAVRLRPGERLTNTSGAKELGRGSGLFLLYGPSVDQVFREAGPAETPAVLAKVEAEFYRQFFRLTA